MGKLGDEVRRLREAVEAFEPYAIPIHVRTLTKAIAREEAREAGAVAPPYDDEELRAMYESDLKAASGGGVIGEYRQASGWQGPFEQRLLDLWQESARRRVEMCQSLSLREVYEQREDVHDELDEEEAAIWELLMHNPHENDREEYDND